MSLVASETQTAYVHAWADCCDGCIRPGDEVMKVDGVLMHAEHAPPEVP